MTTPGRTRPGRPTKVVGICGISGIAVECVKQVGCSMLCVWMLRAIRWSWRAFFAAGLTGLTLGFLLLDGLPAAGHAELLLQIEEITKEIAQRPTDPELYLRRGELRRAHLEWDEALADYQRGQTLS